MGTDTPVNPCLLSEMKRFPGATRGPVISMEWTSRGPASMEKEWETQRERRDEETCIVGGEGEGEKVDKGERKSENKQTNKKI